MLADRTYFKAVARPLARASRVVPSGAKTLSEQLGVVRMTKFALTLVAAASVIGSTIKTALAIAPFKKEFDELYVKNSKNEEFVAAAKKANCLICHGKNAEGKEDKKVRNAYGKALDKLLDKKADAK